MEPLEAQIDDTFQKIETLKDPEEYMNQDQPF